MIMVGFDGQFLTDDLKNLIEVYKVGSIILFSRNIESAGQLTHLTSQLQKSAIESSPHFPLIIATDQENGIVSRLDNLMVKFPGSMALGAANDLQATHEVSRATADALKAVGINMNLAPVLDANNNPENPVIGVRSFGEDVQLVAKHGREFIKGHLSEGIMTSGKHFPGHGNTKSDSHEELPVVAATYQELKKTEFVPFIEAINNDVPSLLISHVHYEAIDPHQKIPASVSANVITELLRKELGYEGLVITDCLEMKAVSQTLGVSKGALQALKAGADIVMVSHTYSEQLKTIQCIEQAVLAGELEVAVINRAVARIQQAKRKYLSPNKPEEIPQQQLNNYKELAKATYEKGMSVVKQEWNFTHTSVKHIHVVWLMENLRTVVEEEKDSHYSLNRFRKSHASIQITEQSFNDYANAGGDGNNTADIIVLFTDLQKVTDKIAADFAGIYQKEKVIVAALKSPYILAHFEKAAGWIAGYEPSEQTIYAALQIVLNELEPQGILPVTLNG